MEKWHSMSQNDERSKSPDRSQMYVFLGFVTELISLQKQLYVSYPGDRYFRGQILTTVGLPNVHTALFDMIPGTSEIAIYRSAN